LAEVRHDLVELLLSKLLKEGRPVQVEVTGSSMTPFIRSHDLVTLRPRAQRRLGLGEVVAVRQAGRRLIVHRVVGQSAGRLVTRGDGASAADGPANDAEVIAVVGRVERRGRRVRLGLGPERWLLGLLSRFGLLSPLLRLYGRLRGQSQNSSASAS
jgi:phage repressor protein C with HTH and peptisase S24 domain